MAMQATIVASTNADWIQDFQFTDTGILVPTLQAGGSGFTVVPAIVCSAPADANGNPIAGGRPALVSANSISGGSVTGLTLIDPGANYLAGYPPSIKAVASDGSGTGFAAFTTVGNPISMLNSVLALSIRPALNSTQVMTTLGNILPLTGISLTDPSNGKFQIIIPQSFLATLNPAATYYHDLVQTLSVSGFKKRIWTGTLTVDQGLTA